ncbi:MAG: pyridoxal-phosphate dependent enzyme [Oligoflexia bacterium]|nr:pyridoxal-phosphate dependent enzyme [Oligoflexia bacterium]
MLSSFVVRTPLLPVLEDGSKRGIYLKPENLQPFGSYKIRGLASLIRSERTEIIRRGLSAASAGNMGQAVAFAAKLEGISCRIYVPDSAPNVKKEAIRRLGAEVIEQPFADIWKKVVEGAPRRDTSYFVHPARNEPLTLGYGAIAEELLQDLPNVDTVVVPFGVGGLTLGLCRAFHRLGLRPKIYAVEPETAAPFSASYGIGRPCKVERVPSFVDAIGTPEVLPDVYEDLREHGVHPITVSLPEIRTALHDLAHNQKMITEGAGAAAYAAARILVKCGRAENVAAVLSGGNIAKADFLRLAGNISISADEN